MPERRSAPLYKYLKSEHANAFGATGALRVGTLYEYREVEKYGAEIGDDAEGIKDLQMEVPDGRYSGDSLHKFAQPVLRFGPTDVVQMEGVRVTRRFEDENVYVFSMTTEFNPEVMVALGYDACIEIVDSDAFLRELALSMRPYGECKGVFLCAYESRRRPHDQPGCPPALSKDPKYAHQKEARAIWVPTIAEPSPVIISAPDARLYCRRRV